MIAVTVLVQGLTGGTVARLLGVRRPSNQGLVVLGATSLGLQLGRLLRVAGIPVVFLDSNPQATRRAEEAGFRVFFGNALGEAVLLRADLDGRAGAIAMTPNEELNLLFARKAREDHKVPVVRVALTSPVGDANREIVHGIGARVLFGRPRNLTRWSDRLSRGAVVILRRRRTSKADFDIIEPAQSGSHPKEHVLPLALDMGNGVLHAIDDRTEFKRGAVAHFAVLADHQEEADAWLAQEGWAPVEDEAEEAESA